jgi:phosphoribosylglycinamide formyltransferase-1
MGREMTADRLPVVVLISGRGSNLKALIAAVAQGLPADIRCVISNRPDAAGLGFAASAGIPTEVLDHKAFPSRDEFDHALRDTIDRYSPGLVVMAGFMRVLGADFVRHYRGRLVNIHPALLPAFPGLDTHRRAIEAGVREHGASVHFVTEDVDAGPVILQARVPLLPGDSPHALAARVLEQEHRIYPRAIGWFAEGRLRLEGNRVLLDGRPVEPSAATGAKQDVQLP